MAVNWEEIDRNTYRLEVPGGWIYRMHGHNNMVAQYVPKPTLMQQAEPRICDHGTIHATCGDCPLDKTAR